MASVAAADQPLDDQALAEQVARNIRSLASARGLDDKDVAAQIGMSGPKISSRLAGPRGKNGTTWRPAELWRIARLFGVSMDVIYAENETAFRTGLAAERLRTRSEKSERASHLRGLPRNSKPKSAKSLGSPLAMALT